MSVYIWIFLLLCVSVGIVFINAKFDKYLYCFDFGILTLFLCLRFGQGIDYSAYHYLYILAPDTFDMQASFWDKHGEIGWQCLTVLAKMFHVEFWIVMSLIAFLSMICIHLFVVNYCEKYKTLVLVLLYPTIYLTYFFSGVRQGLIMAVFFGILLKWLLHKRYVLYAIGVIFLATIHTAALLYLILLVATKVRKRIFLTGILSGMVLSVFLYLAPVRKAAERIAMGFGVYSGYFGDIQITWFSLAERILMLIIVLLLLKCSNKKISTEIIVLSRIYIMGFVIYFVVMGNPFISSRLAIEFKMAEIVLIPLLCENAGKEIRAVLAVILVMMSAVMTYKNLDFYAYGSDYYEEFHGWNYPYVTIFNQEDILKYKKVYISEDWSF